MRFLRKILIAIGSIIVLAVLKIIFQKAFPHSAIFHYNLFSSIQLLLLLWAILTGLLEYAVRRKETLPKTRLKSFIFFLCLMTFTEICCFLLLQHPRHIPAPFIPAFRDYYNNYDRDILQYNKNISRYDPLVFYRMKPDNHSIFSNIEFSDSIMTDKSGFRMNQIAGTDRPAGLNQPTDSDPTPRILCLGDSYTLGWGVGQTETYPTLLQNLLHQQVLNTGMSSYGTIREVESTRFLDKSGVSTIIIQYCYNDADENEAYVNHQCLLITSPESVYDSAVNMLWWSNLYFPGKYFCTLTKLYLAQQLSRLHHPAATNQTPPTTSETPATPTDSAEFEKEATWFLQVLRHSDLHFDSLRVFVFDIRDYSNLTGNFITALNRQLTVPENSLFFKNHIHPLSVNHLFTADDYYILDEHLRPSGQRKLASFLADAIRSDTTAPRGRIIGIPVMSTE